jgi:hypothetical protein
MVFDLSPKRTKETKDQRIYYSLASCSSHRSLKIAAGEEPSPPFESRLGVGDGRDRSLHAWIPTSPEADPSEALWRKKHAGMTDSSEIEL